MEPQSQPLSQSQSNGQVCIDFKRKLLHSTSSQHKSLMCYCFLHLIIQVLQIPLTNPSTDLLIAASHYGPMSATPTTIIEEDETRKLMGNDNKDW